MSDGTRGVWNLRGSFIVLLPLVAVVGALTSCGTSHARLDVTVAGQSSAAVGVGQTADYSVTVANEGPAAVSNVTVDLNLPSVLTFAGVTSTTGVGDTLSVYSSNAVGGQNPVFGTWTLGAPSTDAGGGSTLSEITINFAATVQGNPGNYQINATAQSNSADGDALASPLKVQLAPSAHITIVSNCGSGTVPGGYLSCSEEIINQGEAAANGVNVDITLPGLMGFNATTGTSGNSKREKPAVLIPQLGTTLVDYGAWDIPAATSPTSPGVLGINFSALVESNALPGKGTISVMVVTNAGNTLATATSSVAVITAPSTPTPPPTPVPTSTYYFPTPVPTPTPSPTSTPHHTGKPPKAATATPKPSPSLILGQELHKRGRR